jgi:transposase
LNLPSDLIDARKGVAKDGAGFGMEIISGVERRRQWRIEDKLRIVAEAERRGARFAEVARRHEVSRSVLWAWRKQARSGALVSGRAPVFMPVQILPSQSSSPNPPAPSEAAPCSDAQQIEIALADGTVIRVGDKVGAAALRRVLSALRG